jgi:formylglycine-generating enzyme required for sulfatase activity
VTRQAVQSARQPLSVVLTLADGQAVVPDANIWVRPASNGSDAHWIFGGISDERGKCTFPIHLVRPSGYYNFKATSQGTGSLIGQWSSVPVNGGREIHIQLHLDGHRSTYSIAHPTTRQFALPGGEALEMVFIPGGRFTMGSSRNEPGRDDDEGPQTGVTLTEGIYVGRYEITQRQWMSVMGKHTVADFQSYGRTIRDDRCDGRPRWGFPSSREHGLGRRPVFY